MSLKLEDCRPGHHYVVEVAVAPRMPIVRAVMSEDQPGVVTLLGAGLTGRFETRHLAYLDVLEEVAAMAPDNNAGTMPDPPQAPAA